MEEKNRKLLKWVGWTYDKNYLCWRDAKGILHSEPPDLYNSQDALDKWVVPQLVRDGNVHCITLQHNTWAAVDGLDIVLWTCGLTMRGVPGDCKSHHGNGDTPAQALAEAVLQMLDRKD